MARPLNREKSKTRSLVLHSATKLFLENGYSNTRIKDIANDSKVGYNEIFRLHNTRFSYCRSCKLGISWVL